MIIKLKDLCRKYRKNVKNVATKFVFPFCPSMPIYGCMKIKVQLCSNLQAIAWNTTGEINNLLIFANILSQLKLALLDCLDAFVRSLRHAY